MDPLGKLCTEGKDLASYLWQVPHDEAARKRIVDLLARIGAESAKQHWREMHRICEDLNAVAKASPSPQQVDVLVSGFDRLYNLWRLAKSGLG